MSSDSASIANEKEEASLILIVEDDVSLAEWMEDYLGLHGFVTEWIARGDIAAKTIRRLRPALVLLDLTLPGLDGIEVCRRVRSFHGGPILMLTARDEDGEEVLGLEVGADDYLAKPVRPAVLLARIRALLRRTDPTAHTDPYVIGSLRLDPLSRSVTLDDSPIKLQANEFDVLHLLVAHAGTALGRDTLLAAIRGIDYDGFDRSVDICVSRLRRKLGDDGASPQRILTLRGTGYLLALDAW